jgi:uncharacterized protein YecE (DUF72 family)
VIQVGLAGWGDHDDLYSAATSAKERLRVYSEHFSVVEVDSSYYAILNPDMYKRWAQDTPAGFSFIVKAYKVMTGHEQDHASSNRNEDVFTSFLESIQPLIHSGKLKAVLFQFPPWFDCNQPNVKVLREAKQKMGDVPVALEFRHQSWFSDRYRTKTLMFMQEEGWIHSICDEPQAGIGSVPVVLYPTDPNITIVRMHGRNTAGWNKTDGANWREVRYLYRYSMEELLQWKQQLLLLQETTQQLFVIFNNNSGGDAAANAKDLEKLLGREPKEFPPRQMNLFDL